MGHKTLELKTNIDYIVANAVASKVARKIINDKHKKTHSKTKIISTYLLEDIYNLIKTKKIYASVTDFNIDKARMGLHLLIRFLNWEKLNNKNTHFPIRTTTIVQVITKNNINKYKREKLFAKKGFKPIYEFISANDKH